MICSERERDNFFGNDETSTIAVLGLLHQTLQQKAHWENIRRW